jgi:hypothetical protein
MEFPTTLDKLPVPKFPLVGAWGKQKISSQAGPAGVAQQFVDAYGIQHEIGISRHTVGPGPNGYRFAWDLKFYTHPGMRRALPIEIYETVGKRGKHAPGLTHEELAELVDRMHAMTADERLWMNFFTLGNHDNGLPSAKAALNFLRDMGSSWKYAKDRLPAEATKHQPA